MTPDEKKFAELLRELDDGPDRPARVDLATAIREARRRRRNRRTLTASVAGVAALAMVAVPLAVQAGRPAESGLAMTPGASTGANPPPSAGGSDNASRRPTPAAPSTCKVELLPVPHGYRKSLVTGGDSTGRYLLGRSYPNDSGSHPVIIWDGDRASEVQMPGNDQRLADISPSGVAVGVAYAGDRPQPYVVRSGKVTRLRGVTAGEATAISDDGRIVGARQVGERQLPVLWSGPDETAVDLPLPGPTWEGIAIGVDSDGTIVGKVQNGAGRVFQTAVWRSGGKPELLPLPQVTGGTADGVIPASFHGGWITGKAFRDKGSERQVYAVRYHLARGEYVPMPAEIMMYAGNGEGWMVGSIDHIDVGLLTDAGLVRLPDLDERTGRYGAIATSVSAGGRVIGGQLDTKPNLQDVEMRAVRWRCH
ncbi:hypothetical protein [Micromonospora eburnea]|uniref:Uncharacterized protein n=1 Tax=Micromonospora eburnea TaxID=227316 RepID=A0A1C6TUZ4_9ACTN|nr:hypothetical protein [Micromonospora eburnea]SCL45626.1 hypothetical protein GA0070604_1044 [Micromonospora eburnea]